MNQNKTVDLLVETANPEVLDRTVQSLGAAVVQDSAGGYLRHKSGFLVRCLGDPGFVQFAITKQGYGRVIERIETTGSMTPDAKTIVIPIAHPAPPAS